jgi:hypothetical protein
MKSTPLDAFSRETSCSKSHLLPSGYARTFGCDIRLFAMNRLKNRASWAPLGFIMRANDHMTLFESPGRRSHSSRSERHTRGTQATPVAALRCQKGARNLGN